MVGASGSGKSTLLNLIGGLDRPREGDVIINGQSLNALDENAMCVFRQKNMGFIFQSYHLIPTMTALENVELPLIFGGESPKIRRDMARAMLEIVGLDDRMDHRPNELSGGQQQRVSIARALVANPGIILADEPTGNLDSKTEAEIIELMHRLNEENKQTFLVVTHDMSVADGADRKIILRDGWVVREEDQAAQVLNQINLERSEGR